MGAPPPSWVLLWAFIEVGGQCGDGQTSSPVVILLLLLLLDGDGALSCFFLPVGMLVKSVLDLLLVLLDGGEPGVETSILHLLFKITCGMVILTTGREGHASSLVATRDLLIRLLLVVVKIAILPLPTWALLPGTLWMMQRRLLPPSMLGLVHTGRSRLVPTCMLRKVNLGRSCLIKSYVAGEDRAFWNGVISTVPWLWVVNDSCRGTPTRCLLYFLQIKDKRIYHIWTEVLVW